MNTIKEIAARLISLCQNCQFVQAYEELFANNTISIDPLYKNEPLKGLASLISREEKFLSGIALHTIELSEPVSKISATVQI